jgi:hypothetical protein
VAFVNCAMIVSPPAPEGFAGGRVINVPQGAV